jgi:hypothetical protein
MPLYANNILSVTLKELAACGKSEGYIKRALAGQRKGEVYCWEHHKKGKQVFIHYHTLKPEYQILVKTVLCNGLEPEIYLKQQEEKKARASVEEITDQVTALVISFPFEIEELMNTHLYTPLECHQLARAAAWLRLINDFDVHKARKLGFASIVDFRNEVVKRCLNEQNATPVPLIRFKKGVITNERVLYRNAQEYKEQGIQCMIHAGVGNVNREMADTLVHAKMIELASMPVKYSWEDVSLMYNDWADTNGKPRMTTSSVKHYLNTPKVKKVWFYARHGKLAADNELQPLINRETPSFPDALWSIDGTSAQLYYLDQNGKIQSDLYIYFVTDACTSSIVGYSVAYAESAEMVENALRYAINTYEYKPYQLQYDNSSANVAFTIKKMMDNMTRVHFPCQAYLGRAKYVESIIGHFQQRVLRKRENFKGGNINTRSLNSKANPELLAKFKAKKNETPELQLPTLDELIQEISGAVNEWNSRGEKRDNYGHFVGESKISRYTSIQHEKRVKVNYFDKISLFMVEQRLPYTYGTNGIEIEIAGKPTHFIVPDSDGLGDFIFANEHLGEKFTIKMDRENPELIALYKNAVYIETAYNKEKYAACVADLKKGEKATLMLLKQKQQQFGQDYATRELERQMAILGELKSTGTDGFGWWDSSKLAENNREAVLEDAANGINDGLTDKQRRILGIGK